VAPRKDRRLAAVMAVDVVGYSRLVGADEAGTLARVRAHRIEFAEPLIVDYHGRVVKLTGDGALVEFASAVDAVECALAIQQGMAAREADESEDRRIRFRIGINIGDIIIEDGDIYGDGVNVAARLEGLAEPGGICIARNVYNQVKNKLAFGFEPMGTHRIKNIAEPVEVYRVGLGPGVALGAQPAPWMQPRWRVGAALVVLLLVSAAGGAWYGLSSPASKSTIASKGDATESEQRPTLPLPDKPSIAVLPFDDLSVNPDHVHLAEGIAGGIIADLSRFRDLFVIARESSFVYEETSVDIQQIAGELGVQYVLEGSLQADHNRVRITVRLINASSGNSIWSERYDQPLDDVFAVQDQVTNKIAASLAGWGGIVARAGREVARRKPPANLEAYEYYLLGVELSHNINQNDYRKALQLFGKSLELDPSYARPYVGIAWAHNIAHDNGWGPSKKEALENWLDAAKKAVALDPLDGEAHMVLGWYYLYTRDIERAHAEIEKAIDLNPNDADTLIHAAGVLSWFGEPERAVEIAERAMRLNPHFPDLYYGPARDAYFHAGYFEKALLASNTRQSISFWDLVYRPLSYAQLDRKEEAATAAAELLEREPEYSAEKFLSDNGTYARDTELNLFLDSHEKAGLPLCATEEQLAKHPEMHRLEQCEGERAKS
jgi:TolB-like protein/class 3 adenylate cyclase/tetratricopeptide (TPR) repeat protein